MKNAKIKTGYNIRYMQFCRRRNTKLHIAPPLKRYLINIIYVVGDDGEGLVMPQWYGT